MKVAVSIPDPIFREAERISRRLGVPRSQLYSRAIQAFVRREAGTDVTARMNAVMAKLPPSPADDGWENPGLEILRREKW